MIYGHALCVHVKSLLSGSALNEDDLHMWVGRLSRMDDSTFKEYMSEVSTLIALRLQGRIDEINPRDFSHLSFVQNSKGYQVGNMDYSTSIPPYWPRDRILSYLCSLDTSEATNQKILAGFMKLKTAIAPRETREPSVKKKKEHYISITAPFSGDESVFDEIKDDLIILTRRFIKKAKLHQYEVDDYFLPITAHPSKDKSFAVIVDGGNRVITSKRYRLQAFSTKGFLQTEEAIELYKSDPDTFCSRLFLGFSAKECSFDITDNVLPKGSVPLNVIFYIPQPGDKERVVAIPTAAMQSLSFPIGKVFKRINSSWKIQGVDSHIDCCDEISRTIRECDGSRMFYSIDMSNFTDRFPYSGLISVVADELVNQQVFRPIDRKILDTICQGSILINETISRYGIGTPMGTFPSFPAASLCNGMVATIAYCKAHGKSVNSVKLDSIPARVIGDDFVCWDDQMALKYKELMGRLGVEIQPSKCLQSTYVAEMCSKIITDLGVFQQKKIDSLQDADSLSAVVEQYSYYGKGLENFLDPGFTESLKYLRDVPSPQGLGPELEDPYWDQRPFLKAVYTALKMGREYAEPDLHMNATDFEIIRSRASTYPKNLSYKVNMDAYTDPFQKNILIEALIDDITSSVKAIESLKLNSEELISTSQRVLELVQAVETLEPSGYLRNRRSTLDFHIEHDLDRKAKPRSNRREHSLSKSDKELINRVQHYQTSEQEGGMSYGGR